jgi:putative Mg2+ transporter-C (MgtC) family protein
MAFAPEIDTAIRLVAASVFGALVGLERQLHGRWAGLRTHIMVSLGSAVFVVAGWEIGERMLTTETTNISGDAVSRVIQGIAAGVGFLGAGTILKIADQLEIKGLTTASSIWLAAAVGTASGLGLYLLAATGTIISLVVLAVLRPMEKHFERHEEKPKT